MTYNTDDDSLQLILKELQDTNNGPKQEISIIEKEVENPIINPENIEEYILSKSATIVNTTNDVINILLNEIKMTPENSELISSVADMIGANNKAIETVTKVHLNREKLKQAQEMEIFRQTARFNEAKDDTQKRPALTREQVMNFISNKETTE